MKKLSEILNKLVNVDLKLYEAPVMQAFGKLEEYAPVTKKELEREREGRLYGKR